MDIKKGGGRGGGGGYLNPRERDTTA